VKNIMNRNEADKDHSSRGGSKSDDLTIKGGVETSRVIREGMNQRKKVTSDDGKS